MRDNATLISSSYDNTIKMWDIPSSTCILSINSPTQVSSIKLLSKNNWLLAAAHSDNVARIWDLSSGSVPHILVGHTDPVISLELIDANTLASAGDSRIIIWDLNTWTIKLIIKNANSIYCFKTLPNGILATSSTDTTIKLWNISNGNLIKTMTQHTDTIYGLDLVGTNVLVSASYDKTIRMWNSSTGLLLKTITKDLPLLGLKTRVANGKFFY